MVDELIDDLLTRGVGEFIDPENKFREKLTKNPKDIVIKFGIDPTRPDIHLGHAVILHKLRKLQDLGCKIVFLIGDYTAQIGDPTGKSKERPEISYDQILFNANTYLEQVGKILDVQSESKYKILTNSLWYQSVTDTPGTRIEEKVQQWQKDREKFNLQNNLTVTLWNFMFSLRHITHSQLIERDMFQKRIQNGEHLYMHELMYPVFQGVDSYAIANFFGTCDLEVGGTDQVFNMLMGRTVMKFSKQEPQAVLAFKILEGLDGEEKMSKSLDNYISITDTATDMYGKVMSIPDSSIVNYFELCTQLPLSEVKKIETELGNSSTNPKDLKMKLAKEIVKIYHGEEEGERAEQGFIETFQKGGIPEEIEEYRVKPNTLLGDFLVENKIIESKSEYNRLVKQGALKIVTETEMTISDPKMELSEPLVLKIGKHRFMRIAVE